VAASAGGGGIAAAAALSFLGAAFLEEALPWEAWWRR